LRLALLSAVPPSLLALSRPVASCTVVVLPFMPMPTAAIALVRAATSGIPGVTGAPTTGPWFTRADHVAEFGVRAGLREYAHGFHLAKVENARHHSTRFDGYRHFDSSRPSALVHQSRPGCGMAMQPHSVRSCLFSFHEMIGRTAHRDARPTVAAAGKGGHAP
jgi:hypothetical protein